MRQSWRDLLFAHWPVDASVLRPLVPPGLRVQEYDGMAWIGIVPFRMAGVMYRPLPDLPWISAFPEVNVRTYVECGGKPGVLFFSLDATNPVAVWAARAHYHLPYFHADITVDETAEGLRLNAARRRTSLPVSFEAEYRPTGEVYHASPGTLEHFLTERYCLYATAPDGRLFRTEVHHAPWPLQPASAVVRHNGIREAHGLSLEGPPPLLHFSRRIDVVAWSPEAVSGRP